MYLLGAIEIGTLRDEESPTAMHMDPPAAYDPPVSSSNVDLSNHAPVPIPTSSSTGTGQYVSSGNQQSLSALTHHRIVHAKRKATLTESMQSSPSSALVLFAPPKNKSDEKEAACLKKVKHDEVNDMETKEAYVMIEKAPAAGPKAPPPAGPKAPPPAPAPAPSSLQAAMAASHASHSHATSHSSSHGPSNAAKWAVRWTQPHASVETAHDSSLLAQLENTEDFDKLVELECGSEETKTGDDIDGIPNDE